MISTAIDSTDMAPLDTTLQMDSWSEQLSEAQISYYSRAEKEYKDIMAKVMEAISNERGSTVERGPNVVVVQGPAGPPNSISVLNSLVTSTSQASGVHQKSHMIPLQSPASVPVSSGQQLVLQSGSRVTRTVQGKTPGAFPTPQGNFQLVMDPRLGLIITGPGPGDSALQSTPVPQTSVPVPIAPLPSASAHCPSTPAVTPAVLVQPVKARSCSTGSLSVLTSSNVSTPSIPAQGSMSSTATSAATSSAGSISSHKTAKLNSSPSASISSTVIPASTIRPTENNAVGGISAGHTGPTNKIVQDDGKRNTSGPDSKEVTFSKVSGKTFPSLVVLARPNLRYKDMTQTKINQERASLDSKVKCVLMYTASKFSEWLIQQGLVRTEQFCSVHSGSEGPLKLKLGLYSDTTKFPFSGGYVWVSDCCPQRFVSLFSGSIFENAPHSPNILLKLMYHWCCQTNVQNIIQWVKVDNFYVKNFFTLMRSVCVAAVHENHEKLGGMQKRVEVGVISLGTTSQDGNTRQVKVEVLGVMDADNKLVRLRAVDPLQDGERNQKRRFVKILEPLREWVHKDSVILTDFTVDKGTLHSMGFKNVHQSTIPDPPSAASKFSNQNIMEYLRRIVPRMFQNTLSLLSRQIIQQFLDELVWRERWGAVPSMAFDSLVSHLASQSNLNTGESLILKLGKIAASPFRIWKYEYWKCDGLIPPEPTESISVPVLTPSVSSVEGKTSDTHNEKESPLTIALTKKYELRIDEDIDIKMTEALKKIVKGRSLGTVVKLCKVPRSFLLEKAKDVLKQKIASGHTVFTEEEEEDLRDHMITLHDWGYTFGRWDIRLLVKEYLETCGRIEHRFKDNFPADAWIERFLSRHPIIRHKMCPSHPSRGSLVHPDVVRQYMLTLSSVIYKVTPGNILNFMEVGLTGDPLKSMALELRELSYPVGKRKAKSAAAMMLACNAEGRVLPAYVIFEGTKPVRVNGGQFAGEYHSSKTGWFDATGFQLWLETVVFPWADALEGKKLLIGDNLANLFTLKSVALCMDKNIRFVSMPCSISGVLSPIDVVLVDKLRAEWRSLTRSWASSNNTFLTVEEFPTCIHELLSSAIGRDVSEQLRKAFRVVGLYPFETSNAMKALENGGVSMNNVDSKQGETKGNKRKRIYIGTDDIMPKKKPVKEPLDGNNVLLDNKSLDNNVAAQGEDLKDHDNNPAAQGENLKDQDDNLASPRESVNHGKDLIKLDSYYYGTLVPRKGMSEVEYKTQNLNMKCPLCQTSVSDNLTLMSHLLGHSEVDPNAEEMEIIHICRYCAKVFVTPTLLEKHMLQAHKGFSSGDFCCLICCEALPDKESLLLHMQTTHVKLDLPYVCSICSFATSQHFKLVDHFYEAHKGGDKLQCPHCLKCVSVCNIMGKKMLANVYFFMHHVRKHHLPDSSKCPKCVLSFVQKGVLQDHMRKNHFSHSFGLNAAVPYDSENSIMMCVPPEECSNSISIEQEYEKSVIRSSLNCEIVNYEIITRCLECNSEVLEKNHFVDLLSCRHCSYVTCCVDSMRKHFELFHWRGRLTASLGLPDKFLLAENMYCICGFNTRNGNILADHLRYCGSGTAYSSLNNANTATLISHQSATFPPLVSLDESSSSASEQWMKALSSKKDNDINNQVVASQKGPVSVLNMLGLVKNKSVNEDPEKHVSSAETEDECGRDRPSSGASNSNSSSYPRKRNSLKVRNFLNDLVQCAGGREDVRKRPRLNEDKQEVPLESVNHNDGFSDDEAKQGTNNP